MSILVRQLLIIWTSSFVGGVWLSSLFTIQTEYLWFILLLSVTFLILGSLLTTSRKIFWFTALVGLGLVCGFYRVSTAQVTGSFDNVLGTNFQFEGVVVDEPDQRDNLTLLSIRPLETKTKILVSTNVYQSISYGDQVTVAGKLTAPENFTTDTGKMFDYVNYLKVRGVYYKVDFAKVAVVKNGQGNPVLSVLFKVKQKFVEQLNLSLSEPEASLMAGLLVGDRRGLGADLQTDFRRAGLIHIIVLSGYNMTIITEGLVLVLASFLSFQVSLLVSAVGVILFALLVGGGATVVRAGVMAVLAILARLTGRIYDCTIALFLAGSVMIMVNPLLLVFDIGFQLSFLATLGLIYLSPVVEKILVKMPKYFGLKEIVVTTISAQLAVLPWLVYVMGEVSLVSLPVNLLVLPLVPFVMLLGFITGVMGFLSSYLALIPGGLANGLLVYILEVVKLSANLKLATITISQLPIWLVIVSYVGLGLVAWWGTKK